MYHTHRGARSIKILFETMATINVYISFMKESIMKTHVQKTHFPPECYALDSICVRLMDKSSVAKRRLYNTVR